MAPSRSRSSRGRAGRYGRSDHPRRVVLRRHGVHACCGRGTAAARTVARTRESAPAPTRPTPSRRGRRVIWALSLVVGTVGGIYGIGGGSLLAPILLAAGFSAYEVAPAKLTATFLTSIGGIATYLVLQATHGGAIVPEWALAAFLCAGGFAGATLARAFNVSSPTSAPSPPRTHRLPRRRPLHPDRHPALTVDATSTCSVAGHRR